MDKITEFFNTKSSEELRQIRKSVYRAMRFSRNKNWNVVLEMIDIAIMRSALARANQSDTDNRD